mmetsp:Transcript_36193/g.56564  ORF Transcript_36193/g.56564 Transcript_36193/m.56564 type:complete len:92 (-) Transcript_36193:71-346(-)
MVMTKMAQPATTMYTSIADETQKTVITNGYTPHSLPSYSSFRPAASSANRREQERKEMKRKEKPQYHNICTLLFLALFTRLFLFLFQTNGV